MNKLQNGVILPSSFEGLSSNDPRKGNLS